MDYLSLKDLSEITGVKVDLKKRDEILSYVEALSKTNVILISNKSYLLEEVKAYINGLDSKKLVFHDWVDQHNELKDLLLGKSPKKRFEDKFKWEKHSLFNEFKTFLSPFLQRVLLNIEVQKNQEQLSIAFSFCVLLLPDDRIFIEQMLFKSIKELFVTSKEKIEQASTEKEIIELLQPLCNDSNTAIINDLSRASYATKLW